MEPALAAFVRGSLDGFTIGFGVLGGLGFGCWLGQEYTASMKKYEKYEKYTTRMKKYEKI